MEIVTAIAVFLAGLVVAGGVGGWAFIGLRTRYAALQQENREIEAARLRLEIEHQAFMRNMAQREADFQGMEEKFRLQFENLSNRIFDEKVSKFKQESEQGIGQMLHPMRERLQEFQKIIQESFQQQSRENFSLDERIRDIVNASTSLSTQAENLSRALKGDNKAQGNWGEVLLERILEDSGLVRDRDYAVQGSLRDEDGRALRPDIIVNLPEGKHIIVDSKVSLIHYERFYNEADERARDGHIRQFMESVRAHVKGLSEKQYHRAQNIHSPDFVLLFIPVEAAYMLAVQQDAELHGWAWEKRIVIVCPTTLFSALRTVASVWRIEQQNRNTLEIARQGGDLYDKIAGFVETMEEVGKKIQASQTSFDKAMAMLSQGHGNILGRTEKLRKLEVKIKKPLPERLRGTPEGEFPDMPELPAEESGEAA